MPDTSRTTYHLVGYSGEKSLAGFHFPAVADGGGNWDEMFVDYGSSYNFLRFALRDLTRMNIHRVSMGQRILTSSPDLPADPMAQRELAIRFSYVDNVTGKKYWFDIPAPVAAVLKQGTDVVGLSASTEMGVFVSNFQQSCVSPDGNAVTVIGARLVGRRS